ncbi:hypothetical protein [Microbacterium sp. S1037]|uniref:hypothetical protein n=1 Tax=Microbacterium sp. S1037 TaxID=3398227 RepID=UPI003AAAB681
MTDARLPGYWLTEMRFQDLSDKEWRVFTGLLMWSVEQGTDGHVPTRYVPTVHLDGVDEEDLDALVDCGVLERVSTGVQLLGWADPRGLRQSTAEQVAKYRQGGRERQAAFRARKKTREVTRDVGGGFHSESSSASAYVPGDSTHDVTRYAPSHPHEKNALPSLKRACEDARLQISAEELLPDAYRIGNGDPWVGYLEIKAAIDQGFAGARNPVAVLRKRLQEIRSPRPVIAKSDEWMYPPTANVRPV